MELQNIYENRIKNAKLLQLPCSSTRSFFNPSKWKNTTRLLTIEELAPDNYLEHIQHGDCYLAFSKQSIEDILASDMPIIIISTHADTVPNIHQLSCKLDAHHHMRGTFDNTITNASVLSMMQEDKLPDNVICLFTGDEETGGCAGAKEFCDYLLEQGVNKDNIYPVALDVTYEGYHRKIQGDPISFTVENIQPHDTLPIQIAEDLAAEGQPYLCAPVSRFPNGVSKQHRAGYSMLDEGLIYYKKIGHGFSICIPCGEGNMHSDYGVRIEVPVYQSYINNLTEFINRYSLSLQRELEESENLEKEDSDFSYYFTP